MEDFKHFCDNPNCPNYSLPMNTEKHYHPKEDGIGIGGFFGVLKTHPFTITKTKVIRVPVYFIFYKSITTTITKTIYLCDICHGALKSIKEFEEYVDDL